MRRRADFGRSGGTRRALEGADLRHRHRAPRCPRARLAGRGRKPAQRRRQLLVTVLGTLQAVFTAHRVSHLVVHALPSARGELGHMFRISLGAFGLDDRTTRHAGCNQQLTARYVRTSAERSPRCLWIGAHSPHPHRCAGKARIMPAPPHPLGRLRSIYLACRPVKHPEGSPSRENQMTCVGHPITSIWPSFRRC